jgi:hypothetical protein
LWFALEPVRIAVGYRTDWKDDKPLRVFVEEPRKAAPVLARVFYEASPLRQSREATTISMAAPKLSITGFSPGLIEWRV